ncbi:MAG: hypothetical protein QNJ41_13050 [Xenococcaceae cyanobacterium MO_188.B32]|nr:hypothetical protein [Xenococcaceae cyanobacterium MO_188.B32]
MEHLSLEKQLTHRHFCDSLEKINDVEYLKSQLCRLHLLYLGQQTMFAQMAREDFSNLVNQGILRKKSN